MPWTMRNLRPEVTKMQGNSDSHWRSLDLIFSSFRIQIVLRGFEIDDLVFSAKDGGVEQNLEGLQRTLDLKFKKTSDLDLAIRSSSFATLDSFLREYHEEIDRFFGFRGPGTHPEARACER